MTGWWPWLFWFLSAALALAALSILYFSLLHDRPKGRRRCPRCWYDMAGTPGLRCPECGKNARRERSLLRTRRRWRRAAAGLGLLALAHTVWTTASGPVRWWAFFPRPTRAFVVLFYDDADNSLLLHLSALNDRAHLTRVERLLVASRCSTLLRRPIPAPAPSSASSGSSGTDFIAALPSWSAPSRSFVPDQDRALEVLKGLRADAWPARHELIIVALDPLSPCRYTAIDILGRLGPSVGPALPILAALISDPPVGGTAVDAMCDLGPAAAPQLDALQRFLFRPNDASTLFKAARLVRRLTDDDHALDLYRAMLREPHKATRLAAAQACAAMHADGAIPDILAAIHDAPAPIRGDGAESLGTLGPAAKPALAALVSDADADTARGAIHALKHLGASEFAPLIAARADDPDPYLAAAALDALQAFRTDIPDLEHRARTARARIEALEHPTRWRE